KLDTSGQFIWAKGFGGKGYDGNFGVSTDRKGNVYATGSFYEDVDFDPGPNTYVLSTTGTDIYVVKWDTDGDFVWAKSIGSATVGGNGNGEAIVVDASSNIYTTGLFGEEMDFDPDSTSTL